MPMPPENMGSGGFVDIDDKREIGEPVSRYMRRQIYFGISTIIGVSRGCWGKVVGTYDVCGF